MRLNKSAVTQLISLACLLLMPIFSYASQRAMVTVEKAVIYSDKYMSAPIGYIKKGKVVNIGEIPRNKSQVYPIVVSGKVGYIRAQDVEIAFDSMENGNLTSERFQKIAEPESRVGASLTVAYLNYASQIRIAHEDAEIKNNEVLRWNGVSLKGDKKLDGSRDLQIIVNWLSTNKGKELYEIYEVGAGLAQRIYEKNKFISKLEGQFLAIPFAAYEYKSNYRVNGYGYTLGGALSFIFCLTENWGIEGLGGLYYTKLTGFNNTPEPYKQNDPSFMGIRLGIGINYRY